ncbi:MAG: hypothetical protein MRERC_14c019 [Mycoplasmataceae bacterium RC_NB112A]|nr:MAG: hypothetical protein MRERC_14c019 [Mycoplasmataceae bacterium RC_NB112A]
MSDIVKKNKNLTKKESDNTWIYLIIWVILSGIVILSVILVYYWWENKQDKKAQHEWIFNVQNSEPKELEENEKILAYEDVRGNIISNHEIAEVLESRINEESNLKEWEKDLEKIRGDLKKVEDLENIKNDDFEQLLKLRSVVYKQSDMLGRLETKLMGDNFSSKQIKMQDDWLENVEQHQDEAFEPIKDLVEYFYQKFYREGLTEQEKTPWNIELIKINGKVVEKDFDYHDTNQTKIDIDYLKSNLSRFKVDEIEEKAPIWKGFTSFLDKNPENSREGSNTQGLTTIETGEKNEDDGLYKISTRICESEDGKDHFRIIRSDRKIKIEFRRELLINRQDKYHTKWYNERVVKGEKMTFYTSLGVEHFLNVVAHELAHAILATIRYRYHEEKEHGSHGKLHDEYTDRIRKMIISDPKHEEFVAWWKEPWK